MMKMFVRVMVKHVRWLVHSFALLVDELLQHLFDVSICLMYPGKVWLQEENV